MNIAIRATFWAVSCGGIGYSLLLVVKPDEELIKQYDVGSKHTDTRRLANQTVQLLRDSQDPNSEISKKIDHLIKK